MPSISEEMVDAHPFDPSKLVGGELHRGLEERQYEALQALGKSGV